MVYYMLKVAVLRRAVPKFKGADNSSPVAVEPGKFRLARVITETSQI